MAKIKTEFRKNMGQKKSLLMEALTDIYSIKS